MLTFFILVILLFGFYVGYRRGLMLQIVYTFGYMVAYLIAMGNYKALAAQLELYVPYPSAGPDSKLVFFNHELSLELDKAFYAAVAFLLIIVFCGLIVQFLAVFAKGLTYIPIVKQVNEIAGGLLNVVMVYVGVFLVLMTLSMLPIDAVQNQFRASGLAQGIVKNTPVFSNQIKKLWVERMIPPK